MSEHNHQPFPLNMSVEFQNAKFWNHSTGQPESEDFAQYCAICGAKVGSCYVMCEEDPIDDDLVYHPDCFNFDFCERNHGEGCHTIVWSD